ncbi:MAG: HEPN domain-containing protein [Deferribacteres bacterium]|nr:HEPN domain-containing protein [Deferribacteres bacterium]
MRKDTKSFMLSSEYDLTTASHMYKTGRYVYVVFMCHMAIEKMLKAIAAEVTGKAPPRTHNLLYLIKLADIKIPQDLFDFVAKINNASVVTRYPEDFNKLIESYPEKVVEEYLKDAERVLKWLKQNEKLKT